MGKLANNGANEEADIALPDWAAAPERMLASDANLLASGEVQVIDIDGRRRDHIAHARALRRLANRLGALAECYEDDVLGADATPEGWGHPLENKPLTDGFLADLAQTLYVSRRKRAKFIDGGLLAEPAWDMLLDLFIHHVRHTSLRTTSVCLASNVPLTTALRWVTILERRGLVQRCETDSDKRATLVQLTKEGAQAVRECLHAFWNRLQLMLD